MIPFLVFCAAYTAAVIAVAWMIYRFVFELNEDE